MGNARDVVVLSGVRTAIGDYGGSLASMGATDLGALVVKEAISRANVAPDQVGHGVLGNVIHGAAKDMYVSRVSCVNGGMSHDSQALTVNRLCGSGLQAIVSAAELVMLGYADVAVGGATESMSNGGYLSQTTRYGARMGLIGWILVGLIAGGAAAVWLTGFLAGQLYGVSRLDPLTFVLVPLGLQLLLYGWRNPGWHPRPPGHWLAAPLWRTSPAADRRCC